MEKEPIETADIIDSLVDTLDELSDKYGFTDEENARIREHIFGLENIRNAEEPIYDAEAEEMVVEEEPEGEEDGEED
jgi:hypothetical protein